MLRLLQRNSKTISNIKYSRNYLQDLAIDRQAIKREQNAKLEQLRLKNIYDLPANNKNPANKIKVKINHKVFSVNPKLDYIKNECWVLQPEPTVIFPQETISAIRKYIITSIKKATDALRCIKKMHVLDAINTLERSHKKVAKVMVRTLYNLIDHAMEKGMNPTRLWVHGCLIGKTKRYRLTRYHAKGRGYRGKRDFCQVRVILYEKQEKQFFQQMATGKCAPGIATLLRQILKDRDADYETLAKFTGITTAKGRQQAKLIFKRKVDKIMLQNKQKGEYVPKKLIEKQVKQQQGQKFMQKFYSLEEQQQKQTLLLREKLYKKNLNIQ